MWDGLVGREPDDPRYQREIALEDVLLAVVGQCVDLGPRCRNFCFGIANPTLGHRVHHFWDQPEILSQNSVIVGWGPELRNCWADVVRMWRATARTLRDTLYLLPMPARLHMPAQSDNTNPFPWGDVANGGGRLIGEGPSQILVAAAGLDDELNHWVAGVAGEYYAMLRRRDGHGP
jgi:hypothetical protein